MHEMGIQDVFRKKILITAKKVAYIISSNLMNKGFKTKRGMGKYVQKEKLIR